MMNTEGVRATIDITSSQSGLENTINMITKLKKQINELDPSTVKLANNIAKLGTQLQKTETEVAKTSTQWAKEEAQLIKNSAAKEQNALKTEKLRLQVEKMSNSVNKSASSFSLSSLSLAAMGINFINITRLAGKLSSATQQLIQNSADYIETQNLFEVSMGKTTDQATEFVNQMSRAFNLNDKTLKSAVGTFNLLGTQMGLTNDQALIFSETLTKLAVDTSSLRNTDVETAFTKLRAGISGEVKPLRQWGIDITEATLKQEALANGITKSYAQMSYAEKSLLRYSAILRQTTADQTDYARTLESPAQLMKQIREQIQALGIAIGNVLLPILYKTLTPLLSIIMVLKEIFVWLGSLFKLSTNFGDTSANTALNIAEDTSDALGSAVKKAKELKKWLGGYDELNNVNPSTSGAGAGSGSTPSIGIDPEFLKLLTTYDNKMGEVANKAAAIRDRILEWLGFTIDENGAIVKLNDGITRFQIIVGTIGGLIAAWGLVKVAGLVKNIVGLFKGLASSNLFVGFLDPLLSGLGSIGGLFVNAFGSAAEGIALASSGISSGFFEAIGGSALDAVPILIEGFAPLLEIFSGLIVALLGVQVAFQGFADVVAGDTFQGIMEILGGVALVVSGVAIAFGAWPVAIGAAVAALLALGTTTDGFKEHFDEIKESISTAIENIVSTAKNIWETVLEPIIENIKVRISEIYENALKPLLNNFGDFMGEVIQLILDLWNNVFLPIVNALVDKYGPMIAGIVNFVVDIVSTAVAAIINVINGIVSVFKGIIEIIRGLIKGDFSLVLEGLKDIFKGAVNALGGLAEGLVNGIIDIINAATGLIWNAVKNFVNGLLKTVNKVLEALDMDTIGKMSGDNPVSIKHVSIPKLEGGGIPPAGSLFWAGEGKTTEFVGDVGGRTNVVNEKQLEAALYSALIRANGDNGGNEEYINEIYIGGNKTDTILNRRRLRRQNMTGKVSA